MRETLKSLSIFSASLLLLLVIASGCVVNIPGCGKRSLPLFKRVADASSALPATAPAATGNVPAGQTTVNAPTSDEALAAIVADPLKVAVTPPAIEKEISFEQPKSPTPDIVSPKSKTAQPTSTPTVTSTPTPWEVERIAYTTEENKKFLLWSMNPDGTGRVRHSPIQSSVYLPLWSPNGKFLAFMSDMVGGKLNLFVMKKENQNIQQLTFYEDLELPRFDNRKPCLTWSPRSDQIAYIYKGQVWLINANDPGSPQSLAAMDPLYNVVSLEWTPRRDNKYVAFLVKEGESIYSLWFANPRLKDLARVAQINKPVSSFSWVTDANHVNYISNGESVYQCSYESFAQKPVLLSPSAQLGPLILGSPVENSSLFLLLAKKTGDKQWRLALINKPTTGAADPGTLKYLTDPGVESAVWSPDGSKIAYVTEGELWVMGASGENKKRIAASGIQAPTWSGK